MVKLVKRTLYRTLASASLSDEELQTSFCQAEALINSRPLTPLSSDPRDSPPLTPAHFLIGNVRTELEPTADGTESTHQKRWRRLQQVSLAFWRRWVREYLPMLQPRTKWTEARPDLQPGDGRASDVPLHQEQVARLVLVLVIVVVLVVLMEMLVVLMEMVVAS